MNSSSAVEQPPGASAATGPNDPGLDDPDTDRARSALLANMRQDLMTPVTAIIQFADMLMKDAREYGVEAFQRDLLIIHEAGRRFLASVHDTLDPEKSAASDVDFDRKIRHDLRTPLNHIIGYCDIWLEDAPDLPLESFIPELRRIRALGCQLLARLDDIVHFTEMATVFTLDLAGERLPDMIRNVVNSLPARFGEGQAAALKEKGSVLVVDDNEINCDLLGILIQREGHTVSIASNGRQALEMLRSQSFDLVLLDIIMPELNGFQVLEQLKADDHLRHLPVIMISAFDEMESVVRCIKMGAEDYLTKPFNPMLLKARLNACLEKKMLRDREVLYLEQIRKEQARSDELLHVILPGEIVKELKTTNVVQPRRYENVAVMFCDIVGFTPYCDSNSNSPERVVAALQQLIEAWEEIAASHRVEKIKTVGDAFMAAAGLLQKLENPVLHCVRSGLEMIAATRTLPIPWQVRIGIHAGPVVAGVIGRRQYLFDLWGDTVNTAARMESHGIPNAITLSNNAWEQVKHCCSGRFQEISVKGKGPMKMFCFEKFLCEEDTEGLDNRGHFE